MNQSPVIKASMTAFEPYIISKISDSKVCPIKETAMRAKNPHAIIDSSLRLARFSAFVIGEGEKVSEGSKVLSCGT